jgi:hypothetical protein
MHGVLQRFKVTGEMSPPPDFTDKNKAWFDMKLLVPITTWRSTPDNVMDSKGYAELIRKICRELELPTTHFLHIGRVVGPTVLELEEIRGDDIRQLGNWDLCVQETTYSAKLPLKAIKPAAGFPTEKGLHWSPREMLEPPQSLQEKIFKFVEEGCEAVKNAILQDGESRDTAVALELRNGRVLEGCHRLICFVVARDRAAVLQ